MAAAEDGEAGRATEAGELAGAAEAGLGVFGGELAAPVGGAALELGEPAAGVPAAAGRGVAGREAAGSVEGVEGVGPNRSSQSPPSVPLDAVAVAVGGGMNFVPHLGHVWGMPGAATTSLSLAWHFGQLIREESVDNPWVPWLATF